jgi:hypothetical protein
MIDQSNKTTNPLAMIIVLTAFWLAGWYAHGNYVADNQREPARAEWNAAKARGDVVGEQVAIDKVQLADCRIGNPFYFIPIHNKCDDMERDNQRLAASYTPAQILRWRSMEADAIEQGKH